MDYRLLTDDAESAQGVIGAVNSGQAWQDVELISKQLSGPGR